MARTGSFIVRHRRWVAVLWVIIILGAGYLNGVANIAILRRDLMQLETVADVTERLHRFMEESGLELAA